MRPAAGLPRAARAIPDRFPLPPQRLGFFLRVCQREQCVRIVGVGGALGGRVLRLSISFFWKACSPWTLVSRSRQEPENQRVSILSYPIPRGMVFGISDTPLAKSVSLRSILLVVDLTCVALYTCGLLLTRKMGVGWTVDRGRHPRSCFCFLRGSWDPFLWGPSPSPPPPLPLPSPVPPFCFLFQSGMFQFCVHKSKADSGSPKGLSGQSAYLTVFKATSLIPWHHLGGAPWIVPREL